MHEQRFGFLQMSSKPEHEHTRACNGSAITVWFYSMNVRNDLVMPRAHPNNAEAAKNRRNNENKNRNKKKKNKKSCSNSSRPGTLL